MISRDHVASESKLDACDLKLVLTRGVTEKTPGKDQLLNAVLLNSLHGVPGPTILTPVRPCNESPSCYIGKSISSYLSKFVLSKILSRLWSLSMIDMLRSLVKAYQPLTQFFGTNAFEIFLQCLPHATSQATPL